MANSRESRFRRVLVGGTNDHFVMRGWLRRYAEGVPGARLVVVKGAGHVLAEEVPETVSDALATVLR